MSTQPLPINDLVTLPATELSWTAARASGPGGQNVNKVSSKVELRFELRRTIALDPGTKGRLRALARSYLDAEGNLLIKSQLTRDQSRNLEDAREKLKQLVIQALVKPKPRRATKPSRGARARRMDDKNRTAEKKQSRKGGHD